MANGVELATAWVRLVPSMEGVQGKVAEALAPAEKEGEKAGDKTGKKWTAGAKAAMVAGSAVVVAGVVAGFKGLYEIGATFDDVTDTIRIGTGAQGDALDGLVQVAKNVGSTVPAEFTQIGTTVADLNTRLGLSGETLETVASQYLEAGRILGQDVDISKTTAAFSAFGIEGDSVIGAMDTLFQVSQATGLGMNELAQTVQTAAPALQNLGFSFEESAALAGTLDKAGLNTTQVMASMSKGLVTLAKDGEAPQEAFQRVTDELQGFVDTGDTAAALDLASQVFGTRGAAQFVGALQSGKLNMDDLMGATGATADTILGVGEETQDFAEKAEILGNRAKLALEPLASAVFTAMGDALTFMMPLMEDFGAWLSENQGVMIAAAAVIGTVLVGAMVAWTASVVANTVAWLASPVTWIILGIIAAISLLVVAILWLVQNWDAVVAWISEVWGGFLVWLEGVTDGFVAWWNTMWEGFGAWITEVWDGFIGWISDTWNGFLGWLGDVTNGFVSWWNSLWAAVGTAIQDIWNGFVNGVASIWNGFWGFISDAVNSYVRWWNSIWGGIGDIIETVFGAIASFIGGVWDGIVSGIRQAVNTLIRIINGAIDGVNGLIGTAGAAFGLELKIPKIPMLATGGTITRSGHVIVGEQGPELLKLPKGAQVNPNYDDLPAGDGAARIDSDDMATLAEMIYRAILSVRSADGRAATLATMQGVR